jgi:hypothetical protein
VTVQANGIAGGEHVVQTDGAGTTRGEHVVQTDGPGATRGEHVVHFYEHDPQLVDTVGPYLSAALRAGEVAVVIATPEHREAFEGFLACDGIDPGAARAEERLIAVDAGATLATFTRNGGIDPDAFHAVIGGFVRGAAASGHPVHAYGEMVALLWEEGKVLAAIELERLWNELGRQLPFSLFCAYASASVADGEHAEALHQVCRLHSEVLEAPGTFERRDRLARPSSAGELVARFPADRDAPGEARRLFRDALHARGGERACVDAAVLVLSELTSNAVRHVGSGFSVTLTVTDATLRLAVEDAGERVAGGAMPVRPTHGLGIVDALALRWGIQRTAAGKAVWAELPLRSSG